MEDANSSFVGTVELHAPNIRLVRKIVRDCEASEDLRIRAAAVVLRGRLKQINRICAEYQCDVEFTNNNEVLLTVYSWKNKIQV